MKFFYINNDLCTGCDSCISDCPSGAISDSFGKRSINHDQCIVCGKCYKECPCGAISVERLEKITMREESLEKYREQIQQLEIENVNLKRRLKDATADAYSIVEKMLLGAFLAGEHGELLSYNKTFVELLTPDHYNQTESGVKLRSGSVCDLLPAQMVEIFKKAVVVGQAKDVTVEMYGRRVSMSVFALAGGLRTLVIIGDLTDGAIVSQKIAERLRETIDRKMEMVQKIGFLLGEEVSVVVENLNSVIDLIENSKKCD